MNKEVQEKEAQVKLKKNKLENYNPRNNNDIPSNAFCSTILPTLSVEDNLCTVTIEFDDSETNQEELTENKVNFKTFEAIIDEHLKFVSKKFD